MTKITALYIRVSTDAQFEEGYSVDAQKEKLRQYCVLKDITEYEYYIDGGWSGSNIDRPEMKRLIADIREEKVSSVVVYKLDRLSRSQKDTVYLLEDVFIPHGCSFISLNENFDTATPYGKAMIGILSVFAQLERENIRERTRMGMYERVKEGLWMGGGKIPFGYDYDSDKNILVPNSHAHEVREIYELYLNGYSTTRLSRMYCVSGDKQISDILSRITYLGKIRYRGNIIDGKHEPLIDPDTWERVQTERKKRARKGSFSSKYLLTGLIYCGKCGAAMRYQKWGGDKLKLYCYSQQSSKKNLIRDENCDNPKADARETEAAVIQELIARAGAVTAAPQTRESVTDTVKILKQKHTALCGRIKRLYELYSDDGDPLLLETINEKKTELNKLSAQISADQSTGESERSLSETKKLAADLKNTWPLMTAEEKRRAVLLCVNRIVITDNSARIYFNF